MSWRYRLYGLEVESALDLGPLPAGDPKRPIDVRIAPGDVPPLEGKTTDWFANREGAICISLPPSGRFLVCGGDSIIVADAVAGLASLRWRLLGIAFGALLHQRGVLPLHCTAVRVSGRVVGLVGESGAGKSTLAAYLRAAGHEVLIDDVCAVAADPADRIVVEPGNGLLRLWGDAMDALGTGKGGALDPEIAKFEHKLPASGGSRIALDALIEIADGDTLALDSLASGERMALCLNHSYCREIMMSLGGKARNLAQCAEVAGKLPAYRLTRPRGLERMPAIVAWLETQLAA